MATTQTRLYTVQDLEKIPKTGPHVGPMFLEQHPDASDRHFELLDGVIVQRPQPTFAASVMVSHLAFQVMNFIQEHNLDGATMMLVGVQLSPRTVFAPSLAYLSKAGRERQPEEDSYVQGGPDLVAELVLHNPVVMRQRVSRYLDAGTRLVWIVNSEIQSVEVYRPDNTCTLLTGTMTLDGYDVLPGLALPLDEIFDREE
jgi:Uma2 family endonuclease